MWLAGIAALALLAFYSYSPADVRGRGAELRKADFASLYAVQQPEMAPVGVVKTDTAPIEIEKPFEPDTAQNILFIGDSMLEGLCRRFIDYTDSNGHELHTVVWYSSTSELWANTDTLQYFMKKYDPTYMVVCLCSNELFVKDPEKRRASIRKIIKKIGDIPFVWISPPNWKDDTGINDVIISEVGEGRYFDSRSLELGRGKDHAHPTFPAAAVWMDTIARWMQSPKCDNPIVMDRPTKDVAPRNVILLQPYYK